MGTTRVAHFAGVASSIAVFRPQLITFKCLRTLNLGFPEDRRV